MFQTPPKSKPVWNWNHFEFLVGASSPLHYLDNAYLYCQVGPIWAWFLYLLVNSINTSGETGSDSPRCNVGSIILGTQYIQVSCLLLLLRNFKTIICLHFRSTDPASTRAQAASATLRPPWPVPVCSSSSPWCSASSGHYCEINIVFWRPNVVNNK